MLAKERHLRQGPKMPMYHNGKRIPERFWSVEAYLMSQAERAKKKKEAAEVDASIAKDTVPLPPAPVFRPTKLPAWCYPD